MRTEGIRSGAELSAWLDSEAREARHRRAAQAVGRTSWCAVILGVLGILLIADDSPGIQAGSAGYPAASRSGEFVDSSRVAARQMADWMAAGRASDAAVLRRIAEQPSALWPVIGGPDVSTQVDGYVTRAVAAGRGPLIVLYGIPNRDCRGASGGGATDANAYLRYVASVVKGLAGRYATLIVEPDAVPQAVNGCAGVVPDRRYALIAEAVRTLRAGGPVRLYLDAGNSGFVSDVPRLAAALQRAGLGQADGFALNVANFFRTEDEVAYGEAVSAATGGKHFVIDTSRNGNGPLEPSGPGGAGTDGVPVWCNPPGRAIGASPRDRPGRSLVDAWMWVKNPGESDGRCRTGEPDAGAWFPDYALGLAGRPVDRW